MEKVFVLIVVLVAVLAMIVLFILEQRRYKKRVDAMLPPIDCEMPKRVRCVNGRFIAVDDIKADDFVYCDGTNELAFSDVAFFYCGDEGLCGRDFGASLLVHRDSGECHAAAYKEGTWRKVGTFETFIKALEATIEMLADSKYVQDRDSIGQLEIWLAEEKEKLAADDTEKNCEF